MEEKKYKHPNSLANLKPIKKGEVRNPYGYRGKTNEEIKQLIKAGLSVSIQLMLDTINDPKQKMELRIRCAEYITDRNLGKSVQPLITDSKMAEFFAQMQTIEGPDDEHNQKVV